ncbi:MAG TPA: glycosyltransferase [Armatimonadota bacterium]|nr:glycosyltransferase [Armatimonadota bacterium]
MLERAWPLPSLQHIKRLTDDCGIIQHAKFWLPDYANGYCVDDNSRALIAAHLFHDLFGEKSARDLLVRYLAFIYYVQKRDGKVCNFINYSRAYLEDEGSPDSLARTIWALGTISTRTEVYLAIPAQEMFKRAIVHLTPTSPPHALAYGLLGLCAYGPHDLLASTTREYAATLADALLNHYRLTRAEGWEWFSPALTYGNARMPEALLRAGILLDRDDLRDAGITTLNFLNSICFRDDYLSVVGCHGWYPLGGQCALFDQQPIDAGGMVEANLVAYRYMRQDRYFENAVRAMDWFYGKNILGVSLYDEWSGGCHDGLHTQGVNENQGAESTVTHLMAQLRLYQEAPQLFKGNPSGN